ncbi:hypothetical protein W97_05231 [Coniosporium apollinis CBS 100218]|uniref:DUF427 domain-containing protein n=1 Tax=Coniosporium apollinis (strain CBS 100218) TaxID=1168221 RepID=R7YVW5_CONA1|nr:uncharacterized protein W97_05231 [Coniosporium apollinis CBS 100218]EON65988.1 hypothetical protein W97_05231 [Coniosporium apollinis CBS 100218]
MAIDGPVSIRSASGRRVRAQLGGNFVADTTNAKHVWEHPSYPQFYIPITDLTKHASHKKIDEVKNDSGHILAEIWRVSAGSKSSDAVYFRPGYGQLAGLIRLTFHEMDQWYEEDTPIYVHPKDPTKRIDVLPSTRPIEIHLDGHVLAKSSHCLHLIEPLLPTRYYLPPTSMNPAILHRSGSRSRCPYKGEAEYYDVVLDGKVYRDLIWWYRYPTSEVAPIAGALCFYNEKVDVVLDGKKLERPKSKFA